MKLTKLTKILMLSSLFTPLASVYANINNLYKGEDDKTLPPAISNFLEKIVIKYNLSINEEDELYEEFNNEVFKILENENRIKKKDVELARVCRWIEK